MFDVFLPSRIEPKEWPEKLKKSNTLKERMELLTAVHFAGCDDKTWSDLCEAVSAECKNDPELSSVIETCSTGGNPSSGKLFWHSDAVACHVSGMPRSAPVITWLAPSFSLDTARIQILTTLRFLLWAGFDPNAQDKDGNAALHLAVRKTTQTVNESAIKMLLDGNAKVDIKNRYGETPGLLLAQREDFTIHSINTWVRLEEKGEDFTAIAKDGLNILDRLAAAQLKRPLEIREALMDHINSLMDETDED